MELTFRREMIMKDHRKGHAATCSAPTPEKDMEVRAEGRLWTDVIC